MSEYKVGTKFFSTVLNLEDSYKKESDLLRDATDDGWDEDLIYEVTITKVLKLTNEYRLEEEKPKVSKGKK